MQAQYPGYQRQLRGKQSGLGLGGCVEELLLLLLLLLVLRQRGLSYARVGCWCK